MFEIFTCLRTESVLLSIVSKLINVATVGLSRWDLAELTELKCEQN